MNENSIIFDVAVIGAGPAGMMAAGRAGELGAKVLLLEKNKSLGRKLLLTGKRRSNIAKAEFNPKELAKKYGKEGDFLLYPLSAFGAKETVEFFEKKGLKIKIERGKRIFPQSDKASDVLNILIDYLKSSGVKIMTNSGVKKILKQKNRVSKIILKNNKEISSENYIIATGGKSFPGTGSTGDGYKWAEEMGHTVTKLRPAIVPIKIKEKWPKKAQGLSLKNVKLTIFQNGRKKDSRFGEMLFTHFGISGPIVLDLSGEVGKLLDKGGVNPHTKQELAAEGGKMSEAYSCYGVGVNPYTKQELAAEGGKMSEAYSCYGVGVKLFIDLKPALDFQTLGRRIQGDFLKYNNKLFKNSLSGLLPQKLISIMVELSGINPEKKVNEITRKERQKLVKLFKGLEMTVSSLLGFDMAIITSGGISLKEIDSKTMKSKLIENLFFAGEIIDLHGPTGGYNLQLCWSTGYLAGQMAANSASRPEV